MLVHWLWLATRGCLSDRSRYRLLTHFADAEEIYYADEASLARVEELSEEALAALKDKSLQPAEKILAICNRENIRILTWQDAAYPHRLKNIPDPPVVLYYKGHLPDFDALPLIGVVGTRHASAYGLSTAKRMGYQIAACGGIVVSGLAAGVDAMAMRGALTANAPVIGVLGCGADVVYPLSNRALFADTEKYGCILTEFAPGTPPNKWNFPKRNRIISGLSCGVLVVEAPEGSGALITARQANDQGRDVYVVPGNIDVDTCKGSNALLRDGAIVASSGWDVVGEYEHLFPGKIRQSTAPLPKMEEMAQEENPLPRVAQKPKLPVKKAEKGILGKKKVIDNDGVTPYIDAEAKRPALTPEEEKIVALLENGDCLADELVARLELPVGKVLATLTMLEIKGVVRRLPGKRVELKK